jgi:hypothetical protein
MVPVWSRLPVEIPALALAVASADPRPMFLVNIAAYLVIGVVVWIALGALVGPTEPRIQLPIFLIVMFVLLVAAIVKGGKPTPPSA